VNDNSTNAMNVTFVSSTLFSNLSKNTLSFKMLFVEHL